MGFLTLIQRKLSRQSRLRDHEKSVVVYTAIAGTYDKPPTVKEPDPRIRWYCFADHLKEAPDPWSLISIESYFKDPKLTSGFLKANPNLLFPQETIAVWVDANLHEIRIEADSMHSLMKLSAFAMPGHRERTDVRSEAKVIVDASLNCWPN